MREAGEAKGSPREPGAGGCGQHAPGAWPAHSGRAGLPPARGALRTGAVSDSVSMTARKSLRVHRNIHKQDSECHLPGNPL